MNAQTQPLDTLTSIRKRRTIKVLSEKPLTTKPADKAFIETLLESAYWAPFHYPAHSDHRAELSSELPFRFYVLDSQTCRQLAEKLDDLDIEAGKLLGMLNTADYLIQATWTPQPHDGDTLFEPNLTNMEHLAAAGAGIQNLLLSATALGRENYWGSGGPLREAFAFELLNMPTEEILLGSLFIFPDEDDVRYDADVKTSPRRDSRGELTDCYRWVSL